VNNKPRAGGPSGKRETAPRKAVGIYERPAKSARRLPRRMLFALLAAVLVALALFLLYFRP
jgi:hypothetical protein